MPSFSGKKSHNHRNIWVNGKVIVVIDPLIGILFSHPFLSLSLIPFLFLLTPPYFLTCLNTDCPEY